jgi:hypothetical protein
VKSPVQTGDFTGSDAAECPNKAFYASKYNVFRESPDLSFSGIFIAGQTWFKPKKSPEALSHGPSPRDTSAH